MAAKYNFVNWVDGMKITRSHFESEENALIYQLGEVASVMVDKYSYGLLTPAVGSSSSLKLNLDVDRAKLLRVTISICKAITPAGILIDINNQNPLNKQNVLADLSEEFKLDDLTNGKSYYVTVSVDPYSKRPVGQPDSSENPPRYPFADYNYSINLLAASDMNIKENGAYHVSIGKLTVVSNGIEIDDKYIPPASKSSSQIDLAEACRDLDGALSQLELHSCSIVQKIYKKEQQNILAKAVLYLTEDLVHYLSTSIHRFRWQVPEQPPIVFVEYFAAMARLIKNSIDAKTGTGKEEMLNYFHDWVVEINQGEFEAIVDEMINVDYNHNDINESMQVVEKFVFTLTSILSKLNKLDFIGDKKKTGIIVTSEKAENTDKPKKRNFLIS
jgi:predicted component of type VI protein secretion system